MEPSSVEDGNLLEVPGNNREGRASMEPSSVEDGNSTSIAVRAAMKRLQWSRPQLRTETGRHHHLQSLIGCASMEPSSVEDGNMTRFGAPGTVFHGFNGAVLS